MAKKQSGFEKTARASKRDDLFSNGFTMEPQEEEAEEETEDEDNSDSDSK